MASDKMSTFLCLLLFLTVVIIGVQAILCPTKFLNLLLAIPSEDSLRRKVIDGDVKLSLYTRENPNEPAQVENINRGKLTKFIVHGWTESAEKPWLKVMAAEHLKKGDFNVVLVDWSKTASESYALSARNTRFVGKLIAYLNLSPESLHIIGHSLGAHVSGFAGREIERLTNRRVFRITALDAAGPLFEILPIDPSHRLLKTDAMIVDAIHTDGGLFGYRKPFGTIDFFPNGGIALQPGCTVDFPFSFCSRGADQLEKVFCSHTRSYYYYISSINDVIFNATRCGSWSSYSMGQCDGNLQTVMGDGYVYNPQIRGKYYLRTGAYPSRTVNF